MSRPLQAFGYVARLGLLLAAFTGASCLAPLFESDGQALPCPASMVQPSARPNIVLILTDDQQYQTIGAMSLTRSLLVDQGTSFPNAFVTLSVCCPSRATILRGQYAHNHGVTTNAGPDGGWPKFHELGLESSTVATWLHDAGYMTALVGKYLNDYPPVDGSLPVEYIPPGWDEWYANLGPIGALGSKTAYNNYVVNENGKLVAYGDNVTDYQTDVVSRQAVDFICRASASGQPFFLYIAPHAPHSPPWPALRHVGTFGNVLAPRTPSFNEADVSDKIDDIRLLPLLNADSISHIDQLYQRQLETLLAVDELVMAVVGALESSGALKQTYIFYTSDNGFHMGEHRLPPGKGRHFEEDIRVPLVIRGPGIAPGSSVTQLVLNNDLAPTFAEIAGVQPPSFVDGRSLMPLLRAGGSSQPWRKAFLVETYALGSAQSGIHTDSIFFRDVRTYAKELYDLRHDPFELQNTFRVADSDVIRLMSSWLSLLRTCVGQACRGIEDSVVPY